MREHLHRVPGLHRLAAGENRRSVARLLHDRAGLACRSLERRVDGGGVELRGGTFVPLDLHVAERLPRRPVVIGHHRDPFADADDLLHAWPLLHRGRVERCHLAAQHRHVDLYFMNIEGSGFE